jgi:AcrR family transcriptional regulator
MQRHRPLVSLPTGQPLDDFRQQSNSDAAHRDHRAMISKRRGRERPDGRQYTLGAPGSSRRPKRLFRERGYMATSLDQIAEAAAVTKGAIYGHFKSKEELLISAIDWGEDSDYAPLNDPALPLRQRLRAFGQIRAADPPDDSGLAVLLEFIAACLRNPQARTRFSEMLVEELTRRTADDEDEPLPGTSQAQVWATDHALTIGVRIYRALAPDLMTPEAVARAYELLAGVYPDKP